MNRVRYSRMQVAVWPWFGVLAMGAGAALTAYACLADDSPWLFAAMGLLALAFGVFAVCRSDAAEPRQASWETVAPPVAAALEESLERCTRSEAGAARGLRFVELTDLPRADPCQAYPHSYGGARVHVIYETPCDDSLRDGEWAVVEFDDGQRLQVDSCNDEGLHGHPLYPYGLIYHAIQEVIGIGDRRRFVFALKEGSFDCLGSSYRLVGVFPTLDAAQAAVSARR